MRLQVISRNFVQYYINMCVHFITPPCANYYYRGCINSRPIQCDVSPKSFTIQLASRKRTKWLALWCWSAINLLDIFIMDQSLKDFLSAFSVGEGGNIGIWMVSTTITTANTAVSFYASGKELPEPVLIIFWPFTTAVA